MQEPSTSDSPYHTRQSFGKAVKRAKTTLPKSDAQATEVVRQLAKDYALPLSELKKKKSGKALSPEMCEQVRDFYMRDEISRQAPGMAYRDKVIVRNEHGKAHIQKRHLYLTLSETFQCYKEEFPDAAIGKSKFAELRPVNVMPLSDLPHNVCCCTIHENMNLLLKAMSTLKVFPANMTDLITSVVCDSAQESCMLNYVDCAACSRRMENSKEMIDSDALNSEVTWQQWETTGRAVRVSQYGVMQDVLVLFGCMLPEFLKHCYIKRKQSKAFETAKGDIDENTVVIQVDFSENYTCVQQDEIQSAHWNNTPVTIFTALIWSQKGHQSYAIVSDSLDHDKVAVHKYMSVLLKEATETFKAKNVKVFSDGAASQFKSKYLFANLYHLQQTFDVSLEWSYFATSHGKGAVDGVGGCVKRSVWSRVKAGKVEARNAVEFFNAAASSNNTVNVIFVSKDDIAVECQRLNNIWVGLPTLPGAHGVHYVKPKSATEIVFCRYTGRSTTQIFNFETRNILEDSSEALASHPSTSGTAPVVSSPDSNVNSPKSFTIGQLVAGAYECGTYIGSIESIDGDKMLVNFMIASSNGTYKWPNKAKPQLIHANFILSAEPKISPNDASLRSYKLENSRVISDQFEQYKRKYF